MKLTLMVGTPRARVALIPRGRVDYVKLLALFGAVAASWAVVYALARVIGALI